MRPVPILYFILLSIFWFACSIEDDTNPVGVEVGELIFSTDTVSFDTLITSRTSITRRFRIFNPSNQDIVLNEIAVAGGENSFYDIIVNGKQGASVEDELLEKVVETVAGHAYLELAAAAAGGGMAWLDAYALLSSG